MTESGGEGIKFSRIRLRDGVGTRRAAKIGPGGNGREGRQPVHVRWSGPTKVEFKPAWAYPASVSATQVIQEIQQLTPSEQAEVIQFAYRLDAERMLSGKELGALAKRMIEVSDPVEKLKIREELTRGFYGSKPDA